jgi:hypothetical protein
MMMVAMLLLLMEVMVVVVVVSAALKTSALLQSVNLYNTDWRTINDPDSTR